MLILHRYLLSQFCKTFFLSVIAFTFLLIVSRLHETAGFAALGAPLSTLSLFFLYQFPYILPIAIPISSLIASLVLMQKLSRQQEIVACFSAAISLRSICSILLLFACLLSLLNFFLASEVATDAHLSSRRLVQEISSLNPLTLLKNAELLQKKDALVQSSANKGGTLSKEVLIALRRVGDTRISLFFAEELKLVQTDLIGKNVSFISSIPGKEGGFDHLMIESQKETKTAAVEFTHLLRQTPWRLCADYLRMPLLLAKLGEDQKSGNIRAVNKDYIEIIRRVHLGLMPLVFTLMGCSFGLEIGRKNVRRGVVTVSCLTAFTFACFFLGKGSDKNVATACLYYGLPLLLITVISLYTLMRIQRGKE